MDTKSKEIILEHVGAAGIFFAVSSILFLIAFVLPPAGFIVCPLGILLVPLWTYEPIANIVWELRGHCNRRTAFWLALFFGAFGIHKAYFSCSREMKLFGKLTDWYWGWFRCLVSEISLFFHTTVTIKPYPNKNTMMLISPPKIGI